MDGKMSDGSKDSDCLINTVTNKYLLCKLILMHETCQGKQHVDALIRTLFSEKGMEHKAYIT